KRRKPPEQPAEVDGKPELLQPAEQSPVAAGEPAVPAVEATCNEPAADVPAVDLPAAEDAPPPS
ncbi:MAG: hypothetical protein RLZZ440_1879, partial [Planctomycetota bacterium]